jgi:hypothetical protein
MGGIEMSYVVKSFNRYVLYYVSRPASGFLAEIDCFNNMDRSGIIYFHPEGSTLPANSETVNGIYIHFHMSRFNDVITTLREESPLYLALHSEGLHAYIGSHWEPVGEEEGP